tara:strand:- start:1565 stop:3805 length:2241 start_codon:yes stop_codon:yes gene_type:complete
MSSPPPAAADAPAPSTTPPPDECYAFSADINQLLSLIVNTFYSEKDLFMRELVSNASDALDKAKFNGITDHAALKDDEDLRIEIIPDKTNRTLTIFDSGVGMTKETLINDLGTIAKSGTKAFMEAATSGADLSMIGQFGVGFYSAFLVADKVSVVSKPAGGTQNVWESTAGGSFTIKEDTDPAHQIARGTRIVLHLKEGADEYLEESKIKALVSKHTGFIAHDIKLHVERTTEKEVTDDEDEDEDADAGEGEASADGANEDQVEVADADADEEAEEQKKKTKKVSETRLMKEVLNAQKPLWMRSPDDVTKEEYASFYKNIASDWEDHAAVSHFKVEGQLDFRGLLFIPPRPPFDMFQGGEDRRHNNIKLYARRVFIKENEKELMPEYLSFIRGVVDSDDLPLNISRETLQQTRILRVIRKNLVKKSLEMIEGLSEDPEKYKAFYSGFSRSLKLGVHDDQKNRDRIAKLLRYRTSKSDTEERSFEQYVADMPEGQEDMYYVIGESPEMVATSPFVEKIKARGFEVLYMTEAIDEYTMQQLKEYEGKRLVCATEEGLVLPGDDKDDESELEASFKPACDKIKEVLGDRVEKVIVSNRMENSPCCLVSTKYGYSANMQRIIKAQALRDSTSMAMVPSKKIMEINPQHLLVRQVRDAAKKDDKANGQVCTDLAWVMYETSLLTSGFSLDNPSSFADRVHRLVAHGLGLGETPPGVPLPPTLAESFTAQKLKEAAASAEAGQEEEKMEQVD